MNPCCNWVNSQGDIAFCTGSISKICLAVEVIVLEVVCVDIRVESSFRWSTAELGSDVQEIMYKIHACLLRSCKLINEIFCNYNTLYDIYSTERYSSEFRPGDACPGKGGKSSDIDNIFFIYKLAVTFLSLSLSFNAT